MSPLRKPGLIPLLCAAGTLQMETPPSLLVAPKRSVTTCSLVPPAAGILVPNQLFISPPTKNFAFFATTIFSVFELGASLMSNFGCAQSPAFATDECAGPNPHFSKG